MTLKKWFALLLCGLMVLSAFAGCSPAEKPADTTAPKEHVLSVGFGKVDVTPTEPVPLGGFASPSSRISENVRDRLYLSCIVFTDENDNSVMMFAMEALYVYDMMKFAASAVAKATGVPFGNIMLCTNHSHSAPNFPSTGNPAIVNYTEMLEEKMVEVAQAAMADRKPSKMYITTTYPEKINFIRHYVMDDGTYCGDNFGSPAGKKYVGHVREVDNALQLIKFTREGAKDIIMMNWQGHPTGHGTSGHHYSIMSYSGVAVSAIEEQLDVHCMYVLGASGNVNNGSRIASEKLYDTYEDRANALAGYVVAATEYQEVAVGNVQMLRNDVACTPKNGGNNKVDITLNAFSIGDVALVTAPYEMFCENGEAVKAGSPFKMTFVSSCSNGRGSYIPSISTYDYNNKPDIVYGITKTEYAPGTAEVLESAFVDMLKQLYETK